MSQVILPKFNSEDLKNQILKASTLLKEGNLVVIPTETVYGIAADATNSDAVNKIFKLKGRPSNNPLICHVSNLDQMIDCVNLTQRSQYKDLINKLSVFWPGPLTVVVPKDSKISSIVSAGGDTVGVRIPNHPITLQLISDSGLVLAAPSANKSNYISPTLAKHVIDEFKELTPFLIDGGECEKGLESTVLSIENIDNPVILRPGVITASSIEKVLGVPVKYLLAYSDKTLKSPGLLSSHYAPKTPLYLLADTDLYGLAFTNIGLIAFKEGLHPEFDFAAIEVLSDNSNPTKVAKNLYSAMRKLDNLNLDAIIVDSLPEHGIGIAIMDRLRRASKSQ